MTERIAELRQILSREPSREAWERLLAFFLSWDDTNSRAMGIEYAATHLKGWPITLKILQGIDTKHPCWPLASGVCLNEAVGFQGIEQLAASPHIKCLFFEEAPPSLDARQIRTLRTLQVLDIRACREIEHPEALAELTDLEELQTSVFAAWSAFAALLRRLPQLTRLYIHEQSFVGVGSPRLSLRSRQVREDPHPYDLSELARLQQLTEIGLYLSREVRGVGALKQLHRLEVCKLSLRDTDIEPSFLQPLTNLRTLRLRRVQTPDLRPFAHLKKLESFALYDTPIHRTDGLEELTSLKSLALHDNDTLQALELTQSQADLQRLTLKNDTALTEIFGLHLCGSLEHLIVRGCSSLTAFSLERLPLLVSLKLEPCPPQMSLDALSLPPHLQEIECSQTPAVVDVSGLRTLQEITLKNSPTLTTLRGLETCESLQKLYLSDCPNVEEVSSLDRLSALVSFHSLHCPYPWDLSTLGKLPHLRSLYLDQSPHLSDLQGLHAVSPIEDIHLEACEALQSLDGIEQLKHLHTLYLEGNINLANIQATQQLSTLKSLRIIGSPQLTDISALATLPSLDLLVLYQCDALTTKPKQDLMNNKHDIETFQEKLRAPKKFWFF